MSKSIDAVSKYFLLIIDVLVLFYSVNHTTSNTSLSKVVIYPISIEVSCFSCIMLMNGIYSCNRDAIKITGQLSVH